MQSKSPFHSRYRLFDKITHLFFTGMKLSINSEYAPEYIKEAAQKYAGVCQLDESEFVSGRGHHKSVQQRHYEKLTEYAEKLLEYSFP